MSDENILTFKKHAAQFAGTAYLYQCSCGSEDMNVIDLADNDGTACVIVACVGCGSPVRARDSLLWAEWLDEK